MLPILTLNNLLSWDDSMFDGISLPDGVDLQTLIDTIVRNYGEMQLVYPDWSAMRYYSENWFSAHRVNLSHLWDDYNASYDALYNKDAYITETRTPNLTEKRSPNLSEATTHGHTITETPTNTLTESGATEHQGMAFNASAYTGVTKEIPGKVVTAGGKIETANTGTDTTTHTGTDTTTHTGTEKIERREYGNIGVTTSQQMLQSDIYIWKSFNFYDVVAKLYAVDFFVMIY